MTYSSLYIRYIVFALIAILVNLFTQRTVLRLSSFEHVLFFAVFVGTLVGLIVKYLLDSRWIFNSVKTSAQKQKKEFFFYTLTGIVTTALFWGAEFSFWLIWQTEVMREIGAVLGLGVGYYAKFHLDSRYVFSDIK